LPKKNREVSRMKIGKRHAGDGGMDWKMGENTERRDNSGRNGSSHLMQADYNGKKLL
jgi:hypothetical protein